MDAMKLHRSNDTWLTFLKNRKSNQTITVIGMYISIEYGSETPLVHSATYQIPNDIETEEYVGAIELDQNDNILGGEWKYNIHPNFIWKADSKTQPFGSQDKLVTSFDGSVDNLRSILINAMSASELSQPLYAVVNYLANQAKEDIIS